MKSFGIIHIFLFLILMIAYLCSGAQDYVVTIKNDTIKGDIKPLTYGPDKKVQVTGADKKKSVFPIFQVKRYSYKGEIFQPVKGATGYTFMKLLKPGYLSLYAFQQENQVSYDGLFLVKKDGSSTEVPNLSFKKIMKNFLADCPEISAKVEEGTLSKKELDLIIDSYNNCINSRTAVHDRVVAQKIIQTKKINPWDALEEKVKAHADFDSKANALEMISEIKSKIERSEKIPNFMIEGLKSSLSQTELKAELETALKEVN